MSYLNGAYWQGRSDMLYYKYVDYVVRVIGAKSESIIDVGSGGCPYLEWFDWIDEKVSIDIRAPYSSERVQAITANILDYKFVKKYDLCMCLQVLEHVADPEPFARRLFEMSDTVIISVPYKWPEGKTQGHAQDPVDEEKLEQWVGRKPNFLAIVQEPLLSDRFGRRLLAVYDVNPKKTWQKEERKERKLREMGAIIPTRKLKK
jgi:hypothetical protein